MWPSDTGLYSFSYPSAVSSSATRTDRFWICSACLESSLRHDTNKNNTTVRPTLAKNRPAWLLCRKSISVDMLPTMPDTTSAALTRFPVLVLLRSDNGLVFTSRRYTALIRSCDLKQEFITTAERHGGACDPIAEEALRTRIASKSCSMPAAE